MDKLLIFDQDGTVINSFPAFYAAMKTACLKFGITIDEEFVKHRIGTHSSRSILCSVLEDQIEDLHREYRNVLDNYDYLREVYPHVIPVIKSLRKEYHIAMITAKRTERALYHCKNLKIDSLFEKIVGSPLDGKESQIQDLMEEYNIKKENAVIIGDSINDIRSGKIVGIKTILCLYGYGEKTPELLSMVDKKVTSFQEIPQKVKELF
jgi:phosphoglycolate phosphatase